MVNGQTIGSLALNGHAATNEAGESEKSVRVTSEAGSWVSVREKRGPKCDLCIPSLQLGLHFLCCKTNFRDCRCLSLGLVAELGFESAGGRVHLLVINTHSLTERFKRYKGRKTRVLILLKFGAINPNASTLNGPQKGKP